MTAKKTLLIGRVFMLYDVTFIFVLKQVFIMQHYILTACGRCTWNSNSATHPPSLNLFLREGTLLQFINVLSIFFTDLLHTSLVVTWVLLLLFVLVS